MGRAAYVSFALFLLCAMPARAAVPSTLSYQGVLSDPTGTPVPDGQYDLTFKLYILPSGGAHQWSETHLGVQVAFGEFSVILGSTTPLSFEFDKPYWLGISVGTMDELTPLVELTSSPYALSLRMPFTATEATTTPMMDLTNSDPNGAGLQTTRINVGDPSGTGIPTLYVYGGPGPGVFGPRQLLVSGNPGASGNPELLISGSASYVDINSGLAGNAAVVLPADAVSAAEVLDEPGISQGVRNNTIAPSSGTMVDIVTTTITIPAPGYIVVDASSQVKVTNLGPSGVSNYQIDETAGGAAIAGSRQISYDNTCQCFLTETTGVGSRRTYFKMAGTYTFRLEANNFGTANTYIYDRVIITAMYFPTSYGTVTALASASEAQGFAPTTLDGQEAGADLVDLRELELRVARAREDVDRAQRELLAARLSAERQRAQNSEANAVRTSLHSGADH